jgi:hypothetical protein
MKQVQQPVGRRCTYGCKRLKKGDEHNAEDHADDKDDQHDHEHNQ